MSNKRRRSKVWEHFDETPDQRAICKFCRDSLGAKSENGTSHLKRHLKSCKNYSKKDVNQPLTLASRDEARNISMTHHQIIKMKKLILAEIPFASPDCKKHCYSLIGSIDIDKEICTYYKNEKEKLAHELTSRVCFSFKLGVEYIFVVAHYVDEDFNLVRRLIGVKNIDDGDDLCIVEAIKSCIVDWKLGDKIFSIVGGFHDVPLYLLKSHKDEFSSKMLLNGKFLAVPLCTSVDEFIENFFDQRFYKIESTNIEKFYRYLKTFPNQMETFNNIARERGLPPIPSNSWWLMIDPESYNSVPFKDLENIFVFKDVFGQYEEIAGQLMAMHADQSDIANSTCLNPDTKTDQPSFSKSSVDWKKVEGIVQCSRAASKIINGLYPSNCPSSTLYIPNMVEIEDVFSKHIHHDYCENWVSLLDEDSRKIFEIANALDPRYKLTFSEYYWQRTGLDVELKIDENKKFLEEVFSAYAKEDTREASSTCIESNNTQDRGSLNNSTLQCFSVIDEFSMFIKEKQKNKKSELDKYLDDELVDLDDTNFNLLGWWKKNRSRYPVLSRMARDVLAIPTCEYSTEHIISPDFLVPKEVSHELVEAVICMKEWILSEERSIQESDS